MSLKRKILNIFAAVMMVVGSVPMTFLNTYAADEEQGIVPEEENIPKSLKSVKANKNADGVPDGTYDITLEIEGVSRNQNEATKANVVIVFDTSGSMGRTETTYDYTPNTTGRYGLVNGDYLNLYQYTSGFFGGSCNRIDNDTTAGTVYTSNRCSSRSQYNGTRYSRTENNYGSRMSVAKTAVNALANQLLSQNDPSKEGFEDVVEVAFVGFATNVHTVKSPTTDLDTFKEWITDTNISTGDDAGTNWEAALDAANDVSFGSGDTDKTYVIFVSDGDPTFRNSPYVERPNDCRWAFTCPPDPYGTGNSDPNSYNLNAAIAVANTITAEGSNKELYAVGAFGDATKMSSLGGTYYPANDQNALEAAFADIVDKIAKGLSVADLQIEDGITSATSTEIDGAAGNFRYDVPDAWGTDYAKATFEGGAVHWNPGLDKTLSNGEKASVTFTVWPSQEAMDCIASLRNDGVCDEEDLTKFGLGENADGSFRLITNSTATFRFKTATKVEGSDEPTYSEISIPIQFEEERDPTNLPETELEVTKLWEDSMDPAQRGDIKEVVLKLKVDDDEVRTFVFNKQDESGSEWINSYTYAVAPGVMKELDGTAETEGLRSIAKSIVTVNGVEYAVLEEGHDYLFDESYTLEDEESGTNHYHITKRLYHPMIVSDGGIHDVIFNDDGTAEIEEIELTKLSAENTLNGGISVRKKVINNDIEDTEITDKYPITITLNGADTGKYRIYTYNPDGSLQSRTDKKDYTGGKVEAEIAVNQEIRVLDVPTGVTFEVAEALPSGYTRNEVDYEVMKYDGTDNEEINEVFGNASSTALVTNYLESGDLTIKKTVTASSGDLTEAQKKLFGFTVYFYEHEGDANPVRVDDSTCNLKSGVDNRIAHNGTCTINDIPTGWYYEIVEDVVAGFNKGEAKTETGTIAKGSNEKTFINDYAVVPLNPDDAKVSAMKAFASGYERFWIASDNFTFVMTGNGETLESEKLTLLNKTAEFIPTIANAGTYTYTITEKTTDQSGNSLFREGVLRVDDDEDIVVTIVTRDKGDGNLELVSKTYSKKSQTIYNKYEGDNTYGGTEGELGFTKDLQGRDWRSSDKFDFTISSQDENAPMPEETTITADKNNKTVGFGKITFTNKDVDNTYTYTVTESFDVPSVEAVGATAGGISLTIEVSYNTETGKIDLTVSDYETTFVNEYKTTDVTAAKVWDDDEDRDGLRKNYENYYVAVKDDAGKFVAYEKLALEDKDDYTFADLPEKNAEGEVIDYTIVEASVCSGSGDSITCTEFESDDDYTVTVENGEITNYHEPELYDETGELTVQKIWAGEGNESVRPGLVIVELLANGEVIERANITAGQNNDWAHTFTDLYKNEDGEPIEYSVQESAIGEKPFGEGESVLVIYADDETVVGSWTKSVNNFEVTNTWEEATDEIIYDGADEFLIEKVDEDYEPKSGVVFQINDENKTTNNDGMITVDVPVSSDEKEEEFEFEISEFETLPGYDLVNGSAKVVVSCSSELFEVDPINLVNTYIKTCEFEKSGAEEYVWDGEDLALTVVNKRSLAKSLTIKKTVEGLSAEVLADLEFKIVGPEDFGEDGEMTLKVSEDCTISDDVITCVVDGRVPTGEYTVIESNAEVENFELTVSGDNEVEKEISKDEEAVFEITNTYEVDKITYTVIKLWEDTHNKDGKRPSVLTINLLDGDEIVESWDLSDENEISSDELPEDLADYDVWVYEFEGLPVADENAEIINYVAEEVLESDEYEQTWAGGDQYTTTFVNYHELDPPVDPCADGCGGVPAEPDTGKFTMDANGVMDVTNGIVVAVLLLGTAITLAGVDRLSRVVKRK